MWASLNASENGGNTAIQYIIKGKSEGKLKFLHIPHIYIYRTKRKITSIIDM